MDAESEIVTVEQFERMSPQQRADTVSASTIRSLDHVSDEFRREMPTPRSEPTKKMRRSFRASW